MSSVVTLQQFSNFALQLTAQSDYQALTHTFLKILREIPGITQTTAFEIHGKRKCRIGEASHFSEQLVRRFPLNFSREEQEGYSQNFVELLQDVEEIKFSPINAQGTYTQCLLMVKSAGGPDFAMLLEGEIAPSYEAILADLRQLYRNQMLLHHNKEHDVLTKLPNRQFLFARLLQVCDFYRNRIPNDLQKSQSSWLALLDIDHFKRVNDTFGHLYGDEVLLLFSQIMTNEFRYNDFLFRYGGEEFVVILNLTDQTGAWLAFDRFRQMIEAFSFPTVGKVTVSIGVTHITTSAMPTSLLDEADKALYYAKGNGRNQVVFYDCIYADATEELTDSDIELF